VFYRERGAGVYSTLAHVLSCDSPYLAMTMVTALVFSLLVYFIAGLRPTAGKG
jgi:hypothetical protein